MTRERMAAFMLQELDAVTTYLECHHGEGERARAKRLRTYVDATRAAFARMDELDAAEHASRLQELR